MLDQIYGELLSSYTKVTMYYYDKVMDKIWWKVFFKEKKCKKLPLVAKKNPKQNYP